MNRSIRLRVAFGVFLVVVTLVGAQSAYVLNRFERGFREEIDGQLDEELAELRSVVDTNRLEAWVALSTSEHREESEFMIEVLDADGVIIARSANVLGCGLDTVEKSSRDKRTQYWEYPNPRSRSGARRIRAAEMRVGERTLCVALSLEQVQRWYWNLRRTLATSLLLIAGLGSLAAWWVAARSLRPLAEIAARASSLGALQDGSLPRSGSGDEIDRLAAVLNDLLGRIRSEVLRVRRLTADVAHALRTPLTAIRGNLELQLGRTTAADVESLETSLEQVDELARLVNQLLLLERIESRSLDWMKLEPVDLLALARGLVDHLRIIAEERGVALRVLGDAVLVQADPGQIRQALANLVDNAVRHTPRGGSVEVSVLVADGMAQVRVADTGSGIAPGDLERVFERFYSTASDTAGSTGLGLPIARAIARAHGGDIRASSNAGAVFTLDLPISNGRAD